MKVKNNLSQFGSAWVYGDARVYDMRQALVIGSIGGRNDFATFFKTEHGISVRCGCFRGNIKDFLNSVKNTHGSLRHGMEPNSNKTVEFEDVCNHCEDALRLFSSMTRNGGRGKHADLLIIDEFQDGEKKEC